jgi:nucleoside-diphosphate-sugar epimerase
VSGDRSLDRILPTFYDNLLSAVGVLIAASRTGCSRVILAGSMEEPGTIENISVPGSPYAAAKWAASGYARMFYALYDLPVILLRIFMTYGPGQSDTTKLIPCVVQSLLRGQAPAVGSGKRAVDWVYVEDVAEGIDRACFADGIDGKTIDLGSGTLLTIQDVVMQLVAIINPSITPRFGAIPDRSLEREALADVARTEALLSWRAATLLHEGLEKTVRWYRVNT